MISRFCTLLDLLRFRGPSYSWYLLKGLLWPRLERWFYLWVGPRGLNRITAARAWASRYRHLGEARRAETVHEDSFTAWLDWPVDASVRRVVDSAIDTAADPSSESPRGEIVLGHIDGDGRLQSPWGEFPGFEVVSRGEFVPRTRFTLDLVLLDGWVLIRKDYRGQRTRFLDEWYALTRVQGLANVPSVYGVCEERSFLYRSFIPGETVNDLLVRAGARIRLAETHGDSALDSLDGQARLEAVLERGTRLLPDVMPSHALEELERQLDSIHRTGVARLSLTFGNVVLDPSTGAPWLIDFDGAVVFRSVHSEIFALWRDQDRVKLNRFYDRNLLTENEARSLLRENVDAGYAPVDLGRSLTTRGFWSIDSGTGRWDLLNRRALGELIQGSRILDLGAFHGLMPLLMLSAGARQVVALEKVPENVEKGRHLRRLFEWRDMRFYDLDLRCADMREVLAHEWDTFDVITAFCSLYYLTEGDMVSVVRRASEIAPILVLQAKTDTRPEAGSDKAKKSSLSFLRRLLEEHGFPRVEIVAPAGYTRPLLIGYREVDPPRVP